MVLLFTIRGKKTDSEKDKENAQMHALGTICQIKKKNSRKHHRMAISFRSLLPSIGTCKCIICCDSEKRSFIKIQR